VTKGEHDAEKIIIITITIRVREVMALRLTHVMQDVSRRPFTGQPKKSTKSFSFVSLDAHFLFVDSKHE
jgi:hypothetical protein